jgi:hypothetical protein
MGSGKYLKYAQNKHGIENFTKEILHVFDTAEQMYAKEAEIVNEEFLAEENTYNLKIGGYGGFDYINSDEPLRIAKNRKAREIANANGALAAAQERLAWLRKNDPSWAAAKATKFNKTMLKYYETHEGSMTGKTHTDESKAKMSASKKITSAGKKNSQYGTVWVSNLLLRISYKIKKENLAAELKNPDIIKKCIRDFNKYFAAQKRANIAEADRQLKVQQNIKSRDELALQYRGIKDTHGFASIRELHAYLAAHDLTSFSAEYIRLLLK